MMTPDWKKTLKLSPIFNMSLSSKELFHSNFISWICESYPKEMGEFFSKFLKMNTTHSISDLHREMHNIDLSFNLGDTLVLIENKVKSIAYIEQLEKYSNKNISSFSKSAKELKCILLSLKQPPMEFSDEWLYLSYSELLNQLSTLIQINTYHGYLIQDYINFIKCIEDNIVKQLDNREIQISKLHEKGTSENNFLLELTNLRMHDFFLKGLFQNLSIELAEKIKIALPSINICMNKSLDSDNHTLSIGFGMTRAQGFLEVLYKLDNIHIGIQIQGNQYRQLIVGADNKKVENISHKLYKSEEWFTFKNNDKDIIVYPQKQNIFNQFETNNYKMLYRYMQLRTITNKQLFDIIISDIKDMKKVII